MRKQQQNRGTRFPGAHGPLRTEMKQTQTHAWSPAGEEAVAYLSLLARGKAAAVTRESGEVAACSLARERRR